MTTSYAPAVFNPSGGQRADAQKPGWNGNLDTAGVSAYTQPLPLRPMVNNREIFQAGGQTSAFWEKNYFIPGADLDMEDCREISEALYGADVLDKDGELERQGEFDNIGLPKVFVEDAGDVVKTTLGDRNKGNAFIPTGGAGYGVKVGLFDGHDKDVLAARAGTGGRKRGPAVAGRSNLKDHSMSAVSKDMYNW